MPMSQALLWGVGGGAEDTTANKIQLLPSKLLKSWQERETHENRCTRIKTSWEAIKGGFTEEEPSLSFLWQWNLHLPMQGAPSVY